MDDCSEIVLKKLCCTCLSRDRRLSQLCKLSEGINNLYLLLSYDSEAYREGFFKDTANWYICWECWALMKKISQFRSQACAAQKQLAYIVEGRNGIKLPNTSLSRLTIILKSGFEYSLVETESTEDNFIDCGAEIKHESDDDVPLSELHGNTVPIDKIYSGDELNDSCSIDNMKTPLNNEITKSTSIRKKKKNTNASNCGLTEDGNKKYFSMTHINEMEMQDSRRNRKLAVTFLDAPFKCESCIEGFMSKNELDSHNQDFHIKKDSDAVCDICLISLNKSALSNHKDSHYVKYNCSICEYLAYTVDEIVIHLRIEHSIKALNVPSFLKKGKRKTPIVKDPGSKPRRHTAMNDIRTPYGYPCPDCNKYFETKKHRWKHIQRHHREGHTCGECGKRFAFKNNLTRHEQVHQGPPPREECSVCHKMVRVDFIKIHAKIHTSRDSFKCMECNKQFCSRASYEHHLKYSQAHAAVDIRKYKCSTCKKGYRSRGELKDHINYQHMGKTIHKCPICGKALATRRCITRHVKRAHDGVKESERDKICQQCGKAFRDKKGLREHELIHTGERPLSCEICGCTFRQSASLYTHKKRVHKVFPTRRVVTVDEKAD